MFLSSLDTGREIVPLVEFGLFSKGGVIKNSKNKFQSSILIYSFSISISFSHACNGFNYFVSLVWYMPPHDSNWIKNYK